MESKKNASKGNQMFDVPNDAKGRQFISLLRKYRHEGWHIQPRGRGSRRIYDAKTGTVGNYDASLPQDLAQRLSVYMVNPKLEARRLHNELRWDEQLKEHARKEGYADGLKAGRKAESAFYDTIIENKNKLLQQREEQLNEAEAKLTVKYTEGIAKGRSEANAQFKQSLLNLIDVELTPINEDGEEITEAKCQRCGTKFQPMTIDGKGSKDEAFYCSEECYEADVYGATADSPPIAETPSPEPIQRKCRSCGTIFPVKQPENIFCSQECYNVDDAGESLWPEERPSDEAFAVVPEGKDFHRIVSPSEAKKTAVTVALRGGLVDEVSHPEGIEVIVQRYEEDITPEDIENPDTTVKKDDNGDLYYEETY